MRVLWIVALLGALAGVAGAPPAASAETGPGDRAVAALGEGPGKAPPAERGDGWARTRVEVRDETWPLVVDVLVSTRRAPRRILYMLPGGGLNFEANYFTPRERNLAHFMRERGYLVIGITPREASLPAGHNGAELAGWGLAEHRRDVAKVVSAVDRALRMPYDVLGHSAGGALALDFAATAPGRLGRVLVIDTTGPYPPGDLRDRARASLAACRGLAERGVHGAGNSTGALIRAALTDPAGPAAAFPVRHPTGEPLTNAGAAHYALVHTAKTPGLFNWIYKQGIGAGSYAFGDVPARDRFALAHTPLTVFDEAFRRAGSGIVVTALLCDLFAVWAADPSYSIDWAAIEAEVVWVNAGLGRGDHPEGAALIPRSVFKLVPGYGHGDPVWSATASRDFWPLLT
ncbi:alpha/beta hydrolase [Bailinhaonella thermotolerans]|uniref:Alpha/beta fold hydrolase n=1 Tax=Bailinhaonella thermotolerans TaxID=1070861 RepID=A0A3A4BHR8_9ACTN|nr:alpha/beta hydrolase [Bailinhaonella thermotolerans]RJL34352.1 hypothetical protein D5H75_07880 [Bailinhaonella thermotolerans]